MSDPSDLYTEEWFRDRAGYRTAYHAFARAIKEVFHPESLLDVGCGAGYILEDFVGNIRAWGVDGSQAALDVQADRVRRQCSLRDLADPVRDNSPPAPWQPVDMAISIEVAEHLPEEALRTFLFWFRGARRVLLTAAPPGQGGLHHVNEQPPDYWRGAFAAIGFRFNPEKTDEWKRRARHYTSGCPWVVRNAMFFERSADDA